MPRALEDCSGGNKQLKGRMRGYRGTGLVSDTLEAPPRDFPVTIPREFGAEDNKYRGRGSVAVQHEPGPRWRRGRAAKVWPLGEGRHRKPGAGSVEHQERGEGDKKTCRTGAV